MKVEAEADAYAQPLESLAPGELFWTGPESGLFLKTDGVQSGQVVVVHTGSGRIDVFDGRLGVAASRPRDPLAMPLRDIPRGDCFTKDGVAYGRGAGAERDMITFIAVVRLDTFEVGHWLPDTEVVPAPLKAVPDRGEGGGEGGGEG